jgi:glycosyltransferase involved in cell wall biosynthesis
MDLDLLKCLASERPDWQIILLGPVAKVDEESLPTAANIHYLGMKQYAQLPAYLSGWDIAMLPFAINESTRFISPTKTPEYLAAGLKVVSTPIRDVVRPYGDLGLVAIASGPDEFIHSVESLLQGSADPTFRERANRFLTQSSWDKTWSEMNELIENTLVLKRCAVRATPRLSQSGRPVMTTSDTSREGAAHV